MPIEATLLKNAAVPISHCPNCFDRPFRPFMRGQVQRSLLGQLLAITRWFIRHDPSQPRPGYCALICWECKDIVGHE